MLKHCLPKIVSQKVGEWASLKIKNIKRSILICEAKISQKSQKEVIWFDTERKSIVIFTAF